MAPVFYFWPPWPPLTLRRGQPVLTPCYTYIVSPNVPKDLQHKCLCLHCADRETEAQTVLLLWSLGLNKCSQITCLAAAPESLGTAVLGPRLPSLDSESGFGYLLFSLWDSASHPQPGSAQRGCRPWSAGPLAHRRDKQRGGEINGCDY